MGNRNKTTATVLSKDEQLRFHMQSGVSLSGDFADMREQGWR